MNDCLKALPLVACSGIFHWRPDTTRRGEARLTVGAMLSHVLQGTVEHEHHGTH